MRRILFILLSLFFSATATFAQRARFEITFSSGVSADLSKVYVQPLNVGEEGQTIPLRLKGDRYTASVPVSHSGFYEVVMVVNGGQWLTTIYAPKSKMVGLDVEFDGVALNENSTADNSAISELNSIINSYNRKLWMVKDMPDSVLCELFAGYLAACDSLVAILKPTDAVAAYMQATAYSNARNFYTSIPRAQKRKLKELPFTDADVLPAMADVLDNEPAALIPSAMQLVYATVSADAKLDIRGMMDLLYSSYENDAVRRCVADMLMNRFLVRHNYAGDFDGVLEYLQTIVNDFDLSDKYVREYLCRKSALVGAEFPKEVVLVDSDGKVVDFSKFKGKYVYVDLWASWCGPCCREIPPLQALEKELKGSDVVCVSISTDTDEDAWKAKLVEAGMHGNQLRDRDGSLGTALNVGGIPFFVIYDKEGKLHTYGAQRPSSGDAIKQFLLNLK